MRSLLLALALVAGLAGLAAIGVASHAVLTVLADAAVVTSAVTTLAAAESPPCNGC